MRAWLMDSYGGVGALRLGEVADPHPGPGEVMLRVRLAAPTFIPGRYRLDAFVGVPYAEHVDHVTDALEFDILPPERPWRPYEHTVESGLACRIGEWVCMEALAHADH